MEQFITVIMSTAQRLNRLAMQDQTYDTVEEISRIADEIWSEAERAELLLQDEEPPRQN